ncbi:alpha/beta hydrolase [Streptomyces sp. NPDC018031]|uniref:alpha/beta hydrolase n=1 Tax=Streptomyces sp. NPDC018031 TaxID=3365033 RepID=UPI003793B079
MTSFPELDSPSPTTTAWRTLLALAVVFVLLATTGWTAIRQPGNTDPRAAALAAWRTGSIDGHRLPDPYAPPRQLTRFFDTLSPVQRDRLARRYPLVVGNLNGAPVPLRYRANRLALQRARQVERQRMDDSSLTPFGRREAGRRMHRYTSMLGGGRQILAFDPAGPGRAAEVFGDLSRARHVAVVVPGVDTNILTFQKTRRAYTAPVGMARAVYSAERAMRPRGGYAVIAWADYTAPVGTGLDAATGKLAAEGALRLRAMVKGLPERARVSLLCHSYGSVLCGVAARELSPSVTDIAVAGSPGMRAGHVSDFGTTARVWAMRDADDWIEDVPNLTLGGLGHGADPMGEGFGARRLSAARAEGHSGYFTPGTESVRNFARIGIGDVRSVTCADRADCGTSPSA